MTLAFEAFLICLALTFFTRVPIPIGFLAAASVYVYLKGIPLSIAGEKLGGTLLDRYVIIAVPLFIFTANVMNSGTITEKIFVFAERIVGKSKGGLAKVNVVASLIFSGMTGSAMADAAGLGNMEIQAMKKAGYSAEFSCAITASSAVVGPIFPPSIPMILYSMLSGASVGQLFLGGMVPGVLLAAALMVYISLVADRKRLPGGHRFTRSDVLSATVAALPALFTPVILLGGIYTGVMTPTEAGAVAALYALAVSFIVYRTIGPRELVAILSHTVRQTGTVAIIVGSAAGLSFVFSREQVPELVGQLVLNITDNKYVFLLAVNILFLVLGMFLSQSVIMLVVIPIILPTVVHMDVDLVHFGVLIVVNMMIGLTTPPYGGLLFVTSGISGTKLSSITREIFPMILVMILVLAVITYFPPLVLFLPSLMN